MGNGCIRGLPVTLKGNDLYFLGWKKSERKYGSLRAVIPEIAHTHIKFATIVTVLAVLFFGTDMWTDRCQKC